MLKNKRAFTLIELLVVVLIIGILASVAVPQYQKAVEKSKAAQAITLLKTVFEAAETYYLANGTWPSKFEQLDVDIPWMETDSYLLPCTTDTLSNGNWSIQLYRDGNLGIIIGKLTGPYQGAGFAMFHQYTSAQVMNNYKHQLLCSELYKEGAGVVFTKETGEWCQKIWGYRRLYTGSYLMYYVMP